VQIIKHNVVLLSIYDKSVSETISDKEIFDSEKAGIILDYDVQQNIVGIEVLNASKKMETPLKVEYEVA
jgi:uncharacterized protein YuzE